MSNNVLLLHGALGTQNQFERLKKLLEPRFRVYVLNFSGHGGKNIEEEFSIELFKEDVLRFMKNNSLEKTNIFGFSMGGYVALDLAVDVPGKIEKIMTLGTKINWNPEAAAKELKMLDPDKIETKVPQFAENLQKAHAPADWKTIVRKTAKLICGLGESKPMKTGNYKRIEVPVLAAVGSEDRMVTKEETQALSEKLAQGKFMEIKGFPHPIAQVNQTELSKIIMDYFARAV